MRLSGVWVLPAMPLVHSACRTYLNSTALTGQLEVTWVAKGAAVFARVASANNDGFTPVALPKEALGRKLSMDELMDGMTFINQSINTGDAVPPGSLTNHKRKNKHRYELDTVLEELVLQLNVAARQQQGS